jgi:cell wall-associated NlpC family hydrolase/LysM repeat protein
MKSMSLSKSQTKSPRRFATAVLCSSLLSSFLVVSAHADTYHAVEQGETLGSIARRYHVSPDALRQANQLDLGDNSQLAAMLLRIPGPNEKPAAPPLRDASTPVVKAHTSSTARYFGTVTRYSSYTVRSGDTVEGIAAKFSGNGQDVSVSDLRAKNNLSGAPAVGSTLLIPITTTYGTPTRTASAQLSVPRSTPVSAPRAAANATGDRADVSVAVSNEMELPFAKAIPSSGAPVYQAPTAKRSHGSTLASRGGYIPSPNLNRDLDGAQILQNGETLVTTPTPRVTRTPQPKKGNLAKVAKVAHSGARIRRLPEAGAVTLYNCATGTELAVLKQSGAWSAILMSDRSTGWLPTRYLRFTGASVDVATQIATNQNSDDTDNNWKSGYNSNHPAVRYALQWLGTPYRYGGESRNGIDCSSLVQKSFASCGVKLPRVSRDQAKVGRAVAPENLQPGDRLYFSASGTHIDHTGIYMGGGLFVHASGGAHRVTVSRLTDRRNWNIFVCARR